MARYCEDKWAKWARAACPTAIATLRTTMIAESHFRVLKGKFLRSPKGARLDHVVHITAVDVNDWYC